MKMVKRNPATWLRLILPIILLTGAIATAQPPTVGNVSGTRKDSTGVPVNDPAADRLKADRAAKEKKIKELDCFVSDQDQGPTLFGVDRG